MKRQAEITLAVGGKPKLVRFEAHERLSELFAIEAEILVEDKIDFLPVLGEPTTITVCELEKPVRYFNALVMEAHFVRQDDDGFHYRLGLRPWLHLLAHNRTYRIFEEKSVPDIIKVVLGNYSRRVDYTKLAGRFRPWPYCTQYRESDFAFISRLMEREGIYFYFRHEQDDHVLVLANDGDAHRPAPGYDRVKLRPDWSGRSGGAAEALWNWQEHVQSSGELSYALQSFDYEATRTREGETVGSARNPADSQEVYEFTGDFVDEALAKHWTQVRLEAIRARQRFYTGTGDVIGVACGGLFTLDSDAAFDRGKKFIITALDYRMDAEPYRSGGVESPRRVTVEAVTSDTAWRAPIRTAAPVAGPETAIVMTGGADDSHVDAMGRVRVRFLWGRTGDAPDKARSCWVRVAHGSAGSGFGHVALPRTDQEVIVDFLDGNPDRPIVTGRVYNSDHRHAYDLPANRTRSLFRTDTIGRIGSYAGAEGAPGPRGYNELRFEDKGGDEEVYLRAQRNRSLEVLLDDDERIRRDRTVRVGRDRTTRIRHDDATTVETGNSDLRVLAGGASTTATRDITLTVGANSITINELGIVLRSGMSTLKVDEIGITMNVAITAVSVSEVGITFNAPLVTGEVEGAMTTNSTLTTIGGDAAVTLVGAVINIEGVPNIG